MGVLYQGVEHIFESILVLKKHLTHCAWSVLRRSDIFVRFCSSENYLDFLRIFDPLIFETLLGVKSCQFYNSAVPSWTLTTIRQGALQCSWAISNLLL